MGWLFTHCAVHAVLTRSRHEQSEEGGQEEDGDFTVLQRLSFQRQKGGYGKVDDQRQGRKAGEHSQCQEAGANDFREDAEDEGPAVADVEEIVEGIFVFAEMSDLAQAMVDEEQQAEAHTKDKGAEVEGAVGTLSGEEFFHVRFGIFAKIIESRYL